MTTFISRRPPSINSSVLGLGVSLALGRLQSTDDTFVIIAVIVIRGRTPVYLSQCFPFDAQIMNNF